MDALAHRVLARFLERADLEPPLGYPGGPCQVVERIDKEVRNPQLRTHLEETVEKGKKVENPDAEKVYDVERVPGVGQIEKIVLSPHAQYRMDLRGITVPAVRAAIKSLLKALNDWKSQKHPMLERVLSGWRQGTNFEWIDPKLGLAVVVRPSDAGALRLVTTYWKGEPDPPPEACP
jgi:hypothetical protein